MKCLINKLATSVAIFFCRNFTQHSAYQVFISERWPIYYTRQVCELDDFGRKFGFFESVLKSRYKGILNFLNIKASISQKKFFSDHCSKFFLLFVVKIGIRVESQSYQRL